MVLVFLKLQNNIRLLSHIAENANRRYGWALILFKKQRKGTAGDLFY